jgi:hypothetical protein
MASWLVPGTLFYGILEEKSSSEHPDVEKKKLKYLTDQILV